MTFEEALKLKSELPLEFTHAELPLTTYITPANADDFSRYATDFRLRKMADETAKIYSSDKQFLVRGICYYRDINYFYYIKLPLKDNASMSTLTPM
jgi:hypothetical protein